MKLIQRKKLLIQKKINNNNKITKKNQFKDLKIINLIKQDS